MIWINLSHLTDCLPSLLSNYIASAKLWRISIFPVCFCLYQRSLNQAHRGNLWEGGWSLFTKVDQTSGSKLDKHPKLYTKLRCLHVCFCRTLLKTNHHFASCLNYKVKSLWGVNMKSSHVIRIAIEFPKINIVFVSNRKVHPKCRQDEHLLRLSIHKQNNLFCAFFKSVLKAEIKIINVH